MITRHRRLWLIMALLGTTLLGFAAGWLTRGLGPRQGVDAPDERTISEPEPEPLVPSKRVQEVTEEQPSPPRRQRTQRRKPRPPSSTPTPQAPPPTIPEIPVQSLP